MSARQSSRVVPRASSFAPRKNALSLKRRRPRRSRRGVLLLIVLALLALLTLMGLTLVVATSQGRMSAVAAARANAEAVRDDAVMDEVANQILRGTNDPDSPLQGHSLLEDLYGPPQLFGIVTGVTPLAGGQLINLTVTAAGNFALAPYGGAYGGQVITMLDGPAQGYSGRVVGYVYNVGANTATIQVTSFSGLVPNPANAFGYIGDQFMINGRPFSGTGFGFDLRNSASGGNPYLNLNWTPPTTLAAPYSLAAGGVTGPLLTATEVTNAMPNKPGPMNMPIGMPYAYLPNHAQIQLTPTGVAPYYTDVNGPGGGNESYDAVDFQNMLLAMHVRNPLDLTNATITPIPSLHRPELVAWYAQQAVANANPAINMSGANYPNLMRRKVVLRPEPMDQVFIPATQDTNGNGVWDFREPWVDLPPGLGLPGDGMYTASLSEPFLDLNGDGVWTGGDLDYSGNVFNPITGCWYIDASSGTAIWRRDLFSEPSPLKRQGGLDIDNDNDTIPDSIWVDVGLPVQPLPDGTQYKWLAAILCVDMDGKINLNAHGTIAQLDPNRYYNTSFNTTTGVPVPNPGWTTVSAPVSSTTPGLLAPESAVATRNFPFGQGHGPAEINPAYLLSRMPITGGGGTINYATLNYYANLMMGYAYYDYSTTPPTFVYSVDGKHGESARYPAAYAGGTFPGLYPPTSFNTPLPNVNFWQYLQGGPRPGWSRWIDPWMTYQTWNNPVLNPNGTGWDWVNDPLSLARIPDVRPLLLTPGAQIQGTNYYAGRFFDFISPTLTPNTASAPFASPLYHVPTSHGSPYDLHARGVVATDLRGVPYYAGTQFLPWMSTSWSLVAGYTYLQDLDTAGLLSSLSTTPPAGPLEDAYLSYLNDAVDSPYEFDLSPNAQHSGRIMGGVAGASAAPSDSPITPTELEGVLRVNDPDAVSYRRRLDELESVYEKVATGGLTNTPPPPTTSKLTDPSVRLSLTSESWDLPVASVALTPQQMQDVAVFNNRFALSGPQLNLNGLSLTDLARARIFAENPGFTASIAADTALFGFPGSVGPLLAPEVVMGMRLDINRLLGNGQDDNGNGVVDEPQEAYWTDAGGNLRTEAMTYPWSPTSSVPAPMGVRNPLTGMNNTLQWLDLNNDGLLPAGLANPADPQAGAALATLPDPTLADTRARQLLARQLYVTMMLLLDDRNITANAYLPAAAQSPWNGLAANSRQQAAYVIAQWAINAVDFRDRDSIMTPFEFDIYPFQADDPTNNPALTWNVDDIVGTADDVQTWRGLVWGCERPELLITEAVAFHDRGTADTNQAANQAAPQTPGPDTLTTDATNPDPDFDQVRRPRGSLILELYNPTSPTNAPQRDLQYDPSLALNQPWASVTNAQPWMNTAFPGLNQGAGVNLSQIAVQPTGSAALPASSPVWRLAIAYSPSGYDSFMGGPASMLDRRAPTLPTANISRAVYFTPYSTNFRNGPMVETINELTEVQSFFADPLAFVAGSPLMVPPGQYALVGPASPVTGGNLPATPAATPFMNTIFFGQNTLGATAGNSYPKQLELGGSGTWTGPVGMYSAGAAQPPYATSNTLASTDIKPIVGVPILTNWIAGSSYVPHFSTDPNPGGLTSTLRMSISEPKFGYPIVNTTSIADDGFYYSSSSPFTPAGAPFPQHPLDSGLNTSAPSVLPNGTSPNPRVVDGTTSGYTIVFLQRLANPLVPWNAFTNPYITVDSTPIDLTAYTGESTATEPESGWTGQPVMPAPGAIAFDTRRRGGTSANGQATAPNIWTPVAWPTSSQWFNLPQSGTAAAPLTHHTLGYLNTWEYGVYYSSTNQGSVNPATFNTNTGILLNQYYGDPVTPFPWLTWLDRPYVSQYELMLVPASSPSSLAADFGMLGWYGNYTPGTRTEQYNPLPPAAAGQLPVAQFEHLLNFYDSQQIPATGNLPNLYRIFEHVHVPSRFAGTQTMLTPYPFEPLTGAAPHLFHPPFNWLASYREPGKINLNTTFDPQVFEGLMDAYPGWATLWPYVFDSVQGSASTSPVPSWNLLWGLNGSGIATNPVSPTLFTNPFRADGAGALVPQTSASSPTTSTLLHAWTYPGAATPVYNGVNATLLRANTAVPGLATPVTSTTSLFDDSNFDPNNLAASTNYSAASSLTQYRHAGRNAYFQYQALQRLGNLTTNRSNVYAVWITLGKFEVQQVPISSTNPDGYALVKEVGTDTGEIERKRAFYLIDRSIPVGFRRGENLNVERTVLVERILDD